MKENDNYIYKNKVLIIFIMLPAILVFITELIQTGDFNNTITWLFKNKNALFFNYIISMSIIMLSISALGCPYISFVLTSSLITLFALANSYKVKFLEEPLLPWDIFLYKEFLNIITYINKEINYVYLILIIIIAITLVLLRKFLPNTKFKAVHRVLIAIVCLTTLFSIIFYRSSPVGEIMKKLNIQNISSNQIENYNKNGLLLGFFLNMQSVVIISPRQYSEDFIKSLASKPFLNKAYHKNALLKKRPNIIMVMSEAFWDPTNLKTISFSSDPLPTFREAQNSQTSFKILTPQFGGATCNVEFEVLTGLSMKLLPKGSIPYQQYIRRPIPSIVSFLESNGYQSIAIHPYDKWFWNREEVYKQLGFTKFINKDNFSNPVYKGPFISDEELAKMIIDQSKRSNNPLFIFAISIQNHGPYSEAERYKDTSIKIKGNLSAESKQTLETYTQGVLDADSSFKQLINYFKDDKYPTMIVFFGDHLPFLGKDYLAYKEAGFIHSSKQWTLEDHRLMKSVPALIWTNYEHEKLNIDTISTSFLALYVLEVAGINPPKFYKFIRHFSENFPGYISNVVIDSTGLLYKDLPKKYIDLEEMYRILEYDILFGNQYSKKYLFENSS